MLYYKIVNSDNQIIGAETNEGLRYVARQGRDDTLTIAKSSENAYGITYGGTIYSFDEITLTAISIDEYNLIIAAKQAAEEEDSDTDFSMEDTSADEEVDTSTLEYVQECKLKELSSACNSTIENGVDVELSDGETHHFSLTTQDQLNLITLSSMVEAGQTSIPYHADGELCKFYSAEDITAIITAATAFVTYHTSYYNSLKSYVLALTDRTSVAAITYGTEIPVEYQSEVLSAL